MRNKLPLFIGLAALLQGCTFEPFVLAPDPVTPPAYRNASPDEPNNLDVRWWRFYGDPVLDYLVEEVLKRNPYTEFGELHVAEAKAGVRVAQADLVPNLGVGAGIKDSRTSETTELGQLLGGRSIEGTTYRGGLSATWQIDLWGRIAQAVELAKAQLGIAEATRRSVSVILASEVAVAYWQYRAGEADYALLDQLRAERAEEVRLIAMRVESGLAAEQELVKAQVELAEVEAQMQDALVKLKMNEQELAILMVEPVKDFRVPASADYVLPQIPKVAPGLPALVLARRPDLIDSAHRLKALIAQERIAETAFYPNISLTADYGVASAELRRLNEHGSREFSFGPLSLYLPIFDAGRNRANLEAARLRYRQAVNVHTVNILIALRQVDDALTQVQAAREQIRVLGRALEVTHRGTAVAEARYDRGENNYLQVTDARIESLELNRKLVRRHTDGLLASVRLVEALGGGWDESDAPVAVAQVE